MYDLAVRTLFEGPMARHVPWRARTELERAAFAACGLRDASDTVAVAPGTPAATIAAVGDVALHGFAAGEADERAAALAAVAGILSGADLRLGNLETVLTRREERAGRLGSFLRAVPEALDVVAGAGFDVVTCANNHCRDFGGEALEESVALVRDAGIDVCGVGATPADRRRPVVRTVNDVRLGFLAYCDDWRAGDGRGWQPAGTDDADILADIAALRPLVDVVVLQLHWGWEWAVHPLLAHRDRARRFAEAGAGVVLCHHAHVPMAVEAWRGSVIAHGLGNFHFPTFQRPGAPSPHPWRSRTFALHVALSRSGVHEARIHPVEYRDRRVVPSEGWTRREMLGGLAALQEALDDTDRLALIEMDRTVREAGDFARRVRRYVERGERESAAEVAMSLGLPRGRGLVAALASLPDGSGDELAPIFVAAADGGAAVFEAAVGDGRLQAATARLATSRLALLEPPGRVP